MRIILITSALCEAAYAADANPAMNRYVTSFGKYNADGLSVGQVILNVQSMCKADKFGETVFSRTESGTLVYKWVDNSENVIANVLKGAKIDPEDAKDYHSAAVLKLKYDEYCQSSVLFALLDFAKDVTSIPKLRSRFDAGVGFEELKIDASDQEIADLLENCIDSYIHNFMSIWLKILENNNFWQRQIAAIKTFYAALPQMPTEKMRPILQKDGVKSNLRKALIVLALLFLGSIIAIVVLTILLIKESRLTARGTYDRT